MVCYCLQYYYNPVSRRAEDTRSVAMPRPSARSHFHTHVRAHTLTHAHRHTTHTTAVAIYSQTFWGRFEVCWVTNESSFPMTQRDRDYLSLCVNGKWLLQHESPNKTIEKKQNNQKQKTKIRIKKRKKTFSEVHLSVFRYFTTHNNFFTTTVCIFDCRSKFVCLQIIYICIDKLVEELFCLNVKAMEWLPIDRL